MTKKCVACKHREGCFAYNQVSKTYSVTIHSEPGRGRRRSGKRNPQGKGRMRLNNLVAGVQLVVLAFLFNQFVVLAAFDDASVVEHADVIAVLHG